MPDAAQPQHGRRVKAVRGSARDAQRGPDPGFTQLLAEVRAGRARASERLVPLVYDELRAMARRQMRSERDSHTMQATALVHEAWVRLSAGEEIAWESRAHFFGAAARAMERVLLDHARKRGRRKRSGGRQQLPLDVVDLAVEADLEQVAGLHDALEQLAQRDARMAEIVRLRFFAGLSVDDTARTLGLSERTVRRDWTLARAWLARALQS